MEIKHIHMDQCPSTQKELAERKEQWGPDKTLLISTSLQTQGKGRRDNAWISTPKALAFSFNMSPQNPLSLTSLELGVLICQFFQAYEEIELKLKWPNDVLSSKNAKVGGILCQGQQKQILVGIGLNLYSTTALDELPYPAAGIFENRQANNEEIQSQLPYEIVDYILSHRLSQGETLNLWQDYCAHHDLHVSITDNEQDYAGVFKGVDKYGRAILENGETRKISSGSLRF